MAKYLRSFFVKDELHKHYILGEKLGQGNFATVSQTKELPLRPSSVTIDLLCLAGQKGDRQAR
jgi:hypothetical protein